jgi:diguanylate cyclase (GGDEF)-like protein
LLKDRANQEIYRSQRNGKRLGVAYIDLDGFKAINDMLGHEIGDKVLQDVAQRLTGALRAHDTLARQGGDEFIVLLPDIEDRQAVEFLGRKLLDVFQTPVVIDAHVDCPLQASISISLFPDDGAHFDELVVRADMAMYRAKQGGGANSCCYDTALEAALHALPDDAPLFQLLRDDTVHPDAVLPATGVPLEWERLLSAAFILGADYGTRSSTVVTMSAGGKATLDEQAWLPGGITDERRRYRFTCSV